MCICIYIYMYMYIYIHIYIERSGERTSSYPRLTNWSLRSRSICQSETRVWRT